MPRASPPRRARRRAAQHALERDGRDGARRAARALRGSRGRRGARRRARPAPGSAVARAGRASRRRGGVCGHAELLRRGGRCARARGGGAPARCDPRGGRGVGSALRLPPRSAAARARPGRGSGRLQHAQARREPDPVGAAASRPRAGRRTARAARQSSVPVAAVHERQFAADDVARRGAQRPRGPRTRAHQPLAGRSRAAARRRARCGALPRALGSVPGLARRGRRRPAARGDRHPQRRDRRS